MIGTDFFRRISQAMARFSPKIYIKSSAEGGGTYVWRDGTWVVEEIDVSALTSPFRQVVWLVPEGRTHYRIRRFPLDSVKKSDLSEAVSLDLDSWSPWGEQSGVFFWPVLNQDEWMVSVWVWDASKEAVLQSESELAQFLTHRMPEQAWQLTTVSEAGPALLAWKSEGHCTYAYINESNVPGSISSVYNERDAKLYWRGLGDSVAKIERVLLLDEEMPLPWLPKI